MTTEARTPLVLRSTLWLDGALRYPTADGRVLTMTGPGHVECRVSFIALTTGAISRSLRADATAADVRAAQSDEDLVTCHLEVATSDAALYRMERVMSANVLLDAARLATAMHDSVAGFEPVLEGIRYNHDGRWYLPVLASIDGEPRSVCFYLKNLGGELDLFAQRVYRSYRLVIRLRPTSLGAPGGGNTPEIIVGTTLAAQIVLLPGLVTHGLYYVDRSMPVFALVGSADAPQAAVSVAQLAPGA